MNYLEPLQDFLSDKKQIQFYMISAVHACKTRLWANAMTLMSSVVPQHNDSGAGNIELSEEEE